MSLSVDWTTHVIHIPKSYLTLVVGTLYKLDTNQFRLDLKSIEADIPGMGQLKTHTHNTEVTVAGTTYARTLEILSPYSVEFENGTYSVRLEGSNNNIFDVENGILVQNYVQVIPTNAAGLIVTSGGSGITEQDKLDIADRVWEEDRVDHESEGTYGAVNEWAGEVDEGAIAAAVWNEERSEHTTEGTYGVTDEWAGEVDEGAIADAVWNEERSEHTIEGTYGAVDEWSVDIDTSAIADAVWDESIEEHQDEGTTGEQLKKSESAAIDVDAIADAVWNEPADEHENGGSMGQIQVSTTKPVVLPGR